MQRMKIGIMGGTFNPIHNGHLLLGEMAYEQFGLDKVLIMPTKHPYYKDISGNIMEKDRVAMVQLAVNDNPHFEFSALELNREGTTYTVDTLEELHQKFPENDYYFILGKDSLDYLESWKDVTRIFELCKIIAASRDDLDGKIDEKIAYLNRKYHAEIFRLYSPNLEISSSYLRKELSTGKSCRYLVPDSVLAYIKENRLYG
ncbi:MAG: nicotinate-nucleotide adenylyltransferase [Lachnospiraceae bacterium]|nr:nicotinate-nucleotide adenylyltransferase [Lachnospiraceae bacterium]